ncbi:thioredoxin 1, partial [Tremellales sp. Uapishka_1]
MVQAVHSHDEFKQLIAGDKPVIVDFWATWCGPCKMISPHFVKLADKYPGATFIKVDVEEAPEIAQEAAIRAMPTFKVYKNGNEIDSITGAVPAKLTALIEKHAVAA